MASRSVGFSCGKRVLVFGDFMVDEYVIGQVDRISPEAPVPVLRVQERQRKFGGAGNVVDNLVALGANVRVFGFAGNDEAGRWIANKLKDLHADDSWFIFSDEVCTTVKTRFASRGQQFLRCDEEQLIDEGFVSTTCEQIDFAAMLNGVDAVLISDYAKGAVRQAASLRLIELASKQSIPVLVDPKGSDYSKYAGATACTPNLKELSDYCGKPLTDDFDETQAAQALREECDFDFVFLTRSEKGIASFDAFGNRADYPAQKKEVVDVSGAGDTVACVATLGLASKLGPAAICELANSAAAIVCSKFGTSTVSLEELSEQISGNAGFKLIPLSRASEIAEGLRKAGKRIVFTNGCFDLLHYGHITSFEQAREQGDVLFVAVNSDASIRRLKGENRPIINEHDRLGLISALSCVDYVLLMDDDNPEAFITEIKPDVIVKGKDLEKQGVPEARIVESYGGTVKYIDMAAGLSTTNIIDRVVSRYGESH